MSKGHLQHKRWRHNAIPLGASRIVNVMLSYVHIKEVLKITTFENVGTLCSPRRIFNRRFRYDFAAPESLYPCGLSLKYSSEAWICNTRYNQEQTGVREMSTALKSDLESVIWANETGERYHTVIPHCSISILLQQSTFCLLA